MYREEYVLCIEKMCIEKSIGQESSSADNVLEHKYNEVVIGQRIGMGNRATDSM